MNKAVTKKEKTELAKPGQHRGFEEEVDRSDLMIPRAKLLQALSPEVSEDGSELRQGQVINSLSKDVLPGIFIPVFKYTNWIRFNPRDNEKPGFDKDFAPGQLIYQTNDPHDPRLETDGRFGEDGTPPLATKFLNFLSWFPGHDMPLLLGFCNTSYKAGKKLFTLSMFSKGDMFAKQYRLTTKKTKNDKGEFFVLDIGTAGATPENELKICEQLYTDLRPKQEDIIVHDEASAEGQ